MLGGRFANGLCWKLSEKRVWRQVCTLRGPWGETSSFAFSPDGTFVVSGGSDQELVKIWDAETGAEVRSHRGCALWRECWDWFQEGKPRWWALIFADAWPFGRCAR